MRVGLCCADELGRAGGGDGKSSRRAGGGGGPAGGISGAVLSELFNAVEGEPVQVELSGVRVLFELLGFLLRREIVVS